MTPESSRADLVLRIGAAITVLGLACTAVAMIPLIVTSVSLPPWWWFLAMLVGVGLVVVFVGMAMAARDRARLARTRQGS